MKDCYKNFFVDSQKVFNNSNKIDESSSNFKQAEEEFAGLNSPILLEKNEDLLMKSYSEEQDMKELNMSRLLIFNSELKKMMEELKKKEKKNSKINQEKNAENLLNEENKNVIENKEFSESFKIERFFFKENNFLHQIK